MDYDELVCTLCSFQFDEEQRLPLMIPQCGHSFCSNCLQGLLDKSDSDQKFICPEDKYFFYFENFSYLYPTGQR